jgi:hypothetical protein
VVEASELNFTTTSRMKDAAEKSSPSPDKLQKKVGLIRSNQTNPSTLFTLHRFIHPKSGLLQVIKAAG